MEELRQKMEEIMSVWSDAQRNTRENIQENAQENTQENRQENAQENTRKPIQMQSDTRRNIHTDTQRQRIQQQRNTVKTEQEPKAGEVSEGVEDDLKGLGIDDDLSGFVGGKRDDEWVYRKRVANKGHQGHGGHGFQ